ncbi:hypothetical protein A6M57_0135 [Staphylococcus pseudintermedius]|nr:hypothetical protein SPSE_0101 [Staphylococcus pseudintermedius ED99]ANS88347.1 hypothetical protein A6M57_0135 [Staphylococcus pseudintermedius]
MLSYFWQIVESKIIPLFYRYAALLELQEMYTATLFVTIVQ